MKTVFLLVIVATAFAYPSLNADLNKAFFTVKLADGSEAAYKANNQDYAFVKKGVEKVVFTSADSKCHVCDSENNCEEMQGGEHVCRTEMAKRAAVPLQAVFFHTDIGEAQSDDTSVVCPEGFADDCKVWRSQKAEYPNSYYLYATGKLRYVNKADPSDTADLAVDITNAPDTSIFVSPASSLLLSAALLLGAILSILL